MKKGKFYHVIDSIKGGCGKTTFSIMLTEYLERKTDANDHACLLDVDFLGTGMHALFMGEGLVANYKESHIFLTDKIRKPGYSAKMFVCRAEVEERKLYVAFSDPGYRAKQEYRLTSRSNYTPIVKYGVFRAGIHSILAGNKLEEEIEGNVKDIVLDMSPGCDAYSESIKDCIFDKKYSNYLGEKDCCNYYLMLGLDASHVSAAKEYLRDFMESDGKNPHRIFVVFNDIMQIIEGSKPGEDPLNHYDGLKKEFERMLDKYDASIKNKIFFLVLHPFREYASNTHRRTPLYLIKCSDLKQSVFLETPFRYGAAYGENFKECETHSEDETFKWIKSESKDASKADK